MAPSGKCPLWAFASCIVGKKFTRRSLLIHPKLLIMCISHLLSLNGMVLVGTYTRQLIRMGHNVNETLKTKYPTAKYDPLPGCTKCHGTGEWYYDNKGSPYSHS